MTEGYDCLCNVVVRRLRAANTIFGQNVKLVLRQLSEEQWALLTLPYLLVVPTVTRVRALRPSDSPPDSIINPHSITFLAQLDGRGSESDWMAAYDIEVAEKQLIGAMVNWRPMFSYKPTVYAGMRVEATRAPAVKVAFVFTFFEELFIADDSEDWLAQMQNGANVLEIDNVSFQRCQNGYSQSGNGPASCPSFDPCWPDPVWTVGTFKQEDEAQ